MPKNTIEKDHFNLRQRFLFKLCRNLMNDKMYAEWMLHRWHGKEVSIENPKTFSEKIQWIKLYDRNPLYSQLADKFAVRDYVSQKIGDHYVNKLYAVYDSPDQIKLSDLPNSFILKATHSSGDNLIVSDKSKIDEKQLKLNIKKWLQKDFSKIGREWVYKDIKPRVVCERLLFDDQGNHPMDYKVFCFHGKPHFIQVDVDRFEDHKRAIFDIDWRKQNVALLYEMASQEIQKPKYFTEMMQVARKLSSDIPFVRVDFYALPKLVFGEMTFYPGNGFEPFKPSKWDAKFGQLLRLPVNLTLSEREN